jgi:hypothetical protein
MDIILEETKFNTIAALSASISYKSDNNHAIVNKHVQTERDYSKLPSSKPSFNAFESLPVTEVVDIQFKDLSYFVQKPFSKGMLSASQIVLL